MKKLSGLKLINCALECKTLNNSIDINTQLNKKNKELERKIENLQMMIRDLTS